MPQLEDSECQMLCEPMLKMQLQQVDAYKRDRIVGVLDTWRVVVPAAREGEGVSSLAHLLLDVHSIRLLCLQ